MPGLALRLLMHRARGMKPISFQRNGWACLAVLALALAQWLAAVHGFVHTGHGDEPHRHAPAADEAQPVANSWLTALFAVHDDETDCRLYDQAGHDALTPALVAPPRPAMPAALVVDAARCEALARWAALFQARAPPFS
jgi:hypothetical protein